jgi:hypothetical protein
MPQLMITVDDASLLPGIKKAIKLLRGVTHVSVSKPSITTAKQKTLDAIHEAREGKTIHCQSFEDYLEKVKQ